MKKLTAYVLVTRHLDKYLSGRLINQAKGLNLHFVGSLQKAIIIQNCNFDDNYSFIAVIGAQLKTILKNKLLCTQDINLYFHFSCLVFLQ
jgi:hypothetical protein